MLPLRGSVFTHLYLDSRRPAAPRRSKTDGIRSQPGALVYSYRELVHRVAEVGSLNHQLHLLFRGQSRDYSDSRGRSSLLPTIYRSSSARLSRATLEARFRILGECEAAVQKNRRALQFHIGVSDHPEYPQALLQHYGACPTPLLDLTQSLRVAATFALKDSVDNHGFLYVVAVPHATGSITHHADERIALVRLLNVCPKEALRPHFQEGFLAGRMLPKPEERTAHDFGQRLVAKYRLIDDGEFWSDGFRSLPEDALLPTDDPFGTALQKLLSKPKAPRKKSSGRRGARH